MIAQDHRPSTMNNQCKKILHNKEPTIAYLNIYIYVLFFSKPAVAYMGSIITKAALVCGEEIKVEDFLSHVSKLQLCGVILGLLGWILCLISMTLVQWRVWHIENSTLISSGIAWIGIWDVCFVLNASVSDGDDTLFCQPLSMFDSFIPKEIFIAQDIMSLCCIVEALAICFIFFGMWNIFKSAHHRKLIDTFFSIGGGMFTISGVIVLVPLIWNMHSVLIEQKINFPLSFQLPPVPKRQYVGIAIHVGLISGTLQAFSGCFIICRKCLLLVKKIHPLQTLAEDTFGGESKTDIGTCPRCGSILQLQTWSQKKCPLVELDLSEEKIFKSSKEEEPSQIPMKFFPTNPIVKPSFNL